MKIFITGGTGFLGQRVIKRLQKEYSDISGLSRSENSGGKLQALNIRPVSGSLENIDQWKQELSDIDIIIHCAAPVVFWGKWELYQQGIVDATKNLFRAAEISGVKRFIYISSESVLQDKKDLIDIDETEPYPASPNSRYGKAKMLAEKFILGQESKMESIIIRPPFIWGKGADSINTLIEKVKSGEFIWIDHGRSLFEMVYVDNAADAIVLACEKGTDKNVYFVTDDNTQTVKEFLSKLFIAQGVNTPEKSIPKLFAGIAATGLETLWRIFNIQKQPPITRFDLAFVAMSRKYYIEKIKRDLGYRPVVSEQQGMEIMKHG